jgi:hypothetical protein
VNQRLFTKVMEVQLKIFFGERETSPAGFPFII